MKRRCYYDYADKCDCSDDDRCGCDFPNNMPHNFACDTENASSDAPKRSDINSKGKTLLESDNVTASEIDKPVVSIRS